MERRAVFTVPAKIHRPRHRESVGMQAPVGVGRHAGGAGIVETTVVRHAMCHFTFARTHDDCRNPRDPTSGCSTK